MGVFCDDAIVLRRSLNIRIPPKNFTYRFLLKACARISSISLGGVIHSLIVKTGFCSDRYIGNALLRFYSNCGEIGFARKVFDEMSDRDIVSWSSKIGSYVCSKTRWN
ncbi:hypothetical protein P8452_33737 [Trifolium repens]|nr:hypothetical protein P8452_33737 [Trifolium repens]